MLHMNMLSRIEEARLRHDDIDLVARHMMVGVTTAHGGCLLCTDRQFGLKVHPVGVEADEASAPAARDLLHQPLIRIAREELEHLFGGAAGGVVLVVVGGIRLAEKGIDAAGHLLDDAQRVALVPACAVRKQDGFCWV
jgi:hypothetical protein